MVISNEDKSIRRVNGVLKSQFEKSSQESHFDSIARQIAIGNGFPEEVYSIVPEIKSGYSIRFPNVVALLTSQKQRYPIDILYNRLLGKYGRIEFPYNRVTKDGIIK
jgi:hypothetical protein